MFRHENYHIILDLYFFRLVFLNYIFVLENKNIIKNNKKIYGKNRGVRKKVTCFNIVF